MSQSSRADRRRHQRGGSAPPPRRDPMTMVYVGVGVLFVLVIAVFAGLNWKTSLDRTAAYATPTPGPSASGKPVQLQDGQDLGVAFFKAPVPMVDTPQGGRGQDVDGIKCGAMEYANLHIHSHVALFYNGKQLQIPKLLGGTLDKNGQLCLYWIHTHDASGIIHVEAPELHAPQGGPYTLGNLFDIWGQPLGRDNIAGLKGPVTAYVNGAAYDGDLRAIPLLSHQQIVLEVGTPVPPPVYGFPPND